MIKIDLHTHSTDSHDGGLKEKDYKKLIDSSQLDLIAITDHGSIEMAKQLSRKPMLKEHILVGQELMTDRGELIGLFLKKKIDDGLTLRDTVDAIRKQKGFIIVPHPLDKRRSSLKLDDMDEIASDIDAVEVLNGRALTQTTKELRHWARQNGCALIASSDAHSYSGAGRTYTMVSSAPRNSEDLRNILSDHAKPVFDYPPLRAYLAPKLNRLRKKFLKA